MLKYLCVFCVGGLFGLPSCVSTGDMNEVMGVSPRSKVKTVERSKLVLGRTTTGQWDMLFGGDNQSVMLVPTNQNYGYQTLLETLPKGSEVELRGVKHMGGVDASWSVVSGQVKVDERLYKVTIDGRDVGRLLGLDFEAEGY